MRWLIALLSLLASCACAPCAIPVHVADREDRQPIPNDFVGLSFETSNLLPDKAGKYFFSADNQKLVSLFRTIGIRNLRIGGGTAELPRYRIPAQADIDAFFAFAKAADVKVIYTLRLLNGNARDDAETARYIQQRYASQLECLQIGNEPDWHSYHSAANHVVDSRIFESEPGNTGSAYPSFLKTWNAFATEIDGAVKFTGPDTGSNYPVPGTKNTDFNGHSWTEHFARDEKASERLLFVAQHDYVGQGAAGVSIPTAIASMLSREWVETRYALLFDHVLKPVQQLGLTYRMTEANDYTGGVDGASNAFASALWALDYLHWHAAHHAAGVNFHNKRWIYTDTIFLDQSGELHWNPKAFAIRAFNLGSSGAPTSVTIDNLKQANLTAYAVRNAHELYLTVINKQYGPNASAEEVVVSAKDISGQVRGMFLVAPTGDVTARDGITLGGAPITLGSWRGQWTTLCQCQNHEAKFRVPPATAVVARFTLG